MSITGIYGLSLTYEQFLRAFSDDIITAVDKISEDIILTHEQENLDTEDLKYLEDDVKIYKNIIDMITTDDFSDLKVVNYDDAIASLTEIKDIFGYRKTLFTYVNFGTVIIGEVVKVKIVGSISFKNIASIVPKNTVKLTIKKLRNLGLLLPIVPSFRNLTILATREKYPNIQALNIPIEVKTDLLKKPIFQVKNLDFYAVDINLDTLTRPKGRSIDDLSEDN